MDAESPREQQSPTFQAPGTTFMEDNSSTHRGWVGGGADALGMNQAHDIYCALYFYYYYISSTSDP